MSATPKPLERERSKEFRIGTLLLQNHYPDEALDFLNKAWVKDPGDYAAVINLAACLRQLNYFFGAENFLRVASGLTDSYAVDTNLGALMEDLGRFREATDCYARAYAKCQGVPQVAMQYSFCLMREGRFKEAWPLFEWGRSVNMFAYPNMPRWTGAEPLEGKKLLICREGGYGDAFLYLRWFKDVRDRGAEVHYWTWRSLEALLGKHPWIDRFIPSDEGMILSAPAPELNEQFAEEYDYYVPLMSLPACLGITENVAVPMECLSIWKPRSPGLTSTVRDYPGRHPRRIGLCWTAEEATVPRKHRSLSVSHADEIVRSAPDGTICVSLVPGVGLASGSTSLPKDSTWLYTSEAISCCDLVISCDTAVAHLAGSMGVPAWVLLPMRRDWKWSIPESPFYWYPMTRYFNQTHPTLWTNVVAEVKEALNGI